MIVSCIKRNRIRLLCIFSLAVLTLYVAYKSGFPSNGMEGKAQAIYMLFLQPYRFLSFRTMVFCCCMVHVLTPVNELKVFHR